MNPPPQPHLKIALQERPHTLTLGPNSQNAQTIFLLTPLLLLNQWLILLILNNHFSQLVVS